MKTPDRCWILEFEFDVIEARVRIVLTSDPDIGTKDREIVVGEIVNFHVERYHDPTDRCLGDFEGVTVARRGRCWRYKFDTGDASVAFDSLQKVEF